jgi:hypothetical protein
LALEHRDLLAEREDLQSGIGVIAEEDAHGCEHGQQEFEHASTFAT